MTHNNNKEIVIFVLWGLHLYGAKGIISTKVEAKKKNKKKMTRHKKQSNKRRLDNTTAIAAALTHLTQITSCPHLTPKRRAVTNASEHTRALMPHRCTLTFSVVPVITCNPS